MKLLLEIFLTFLKIGLFTFGGGYAMIPLIKRICVIQKGWITDNEMENITIIAESTPGPIAINCATYIGFKKKGFWGAVVATLGVVIPSFIIILLISFFIDRFLEIKWIASAFKGIKIAVGILIIDAAIKMLVKMNKKPLPIIISSIAFIAMMIINIFALRLSTIILMIAAAITGLAVYLIDLKCRKEVSK